MSWGARVIAFELDDPDVHRLVLGAEVRWKLASAAR